MKSTVRYAILTMALIALLKGGYIHAKAELSQHLLEFAWAQSVTTKSPAKPWPWADTRAIARLSVPRLDLNLIVLDGTSGEAMAFGPGLMQVSNNEGSESFVIGGHRDTHMKFLKNLTQGDSLSLTTINGVEKNYEVTDTFIADTRTDKLMLSDDENTLVLITCYPFEALIAGGPLRYITVATPKIKA